jgi:hypothetical protein
VRRSLQFSDGSKFEVPYKFGVESSPETPVAYLISRASISPDENAMVIVALTNGAETVIPQRLVRPGLE